MHNLQDYITRVLVVYRVANALYIMSRQYTLYKFQFIVGLYRIALCCSTVISLLDD